MVSEDLEGRGHAFAVYQQASSLELADLPEAHGSVQVSSCHVSSSMVLKPSALVGSFMTAQKASAPWWL